MRIFLCTFAALCLLAGPALSEPVGFVAGLEGSVEREPAGGEEARALALDDEVFVGDIIRTGEDSSVKLLMADDTTLTVSDETELEIDEFIVGPQATREPSVLKLLNGSLRTRVGSAFGGTTRLQLHTPTAVMGVKGTEWDTWVYGQDDGVQTLACCLSGLITMENVDPSVTGIVDLPIGMCSRVLPALQPAEPVPLSTLTGVAAVRTPGSSLVATTTAAIDPVESDYAPPAVSVDVLASRLQSPVISVGDTGAETLSSGDAALIDVRADPPMEVPAGPPGFLPPGDGGNMGMDKQP